MLPLIAAAVGGFIGGSVAVGVGCAVAESFQASSTNISENICLLRPARDIPEHDERVRRCRVFLFTKPVEDVPQFNVNPLRHWALIFYFEDDGTVRILEGRQDANGILDAFILKQGLVNVNDPKFYDLGVILKSPLQLRELALQNPLNKTMYHTATKNCQNWVKELAKLLGEKIYNKVNTFWTLKEVNPIFAYSWSMANKSSSFCTTRLKSTNMPNFSHVPHSM